jgi:hypothetical protein
VLFKLLGSVEVLGELLADEILELVVLLVWRGGTGAREEDRRGKEEARARSAGGDALREEEGGVKLRRGRTFHLESSREERVI